MRARMAGYIEEQMINEVDEYADAMHNQLRADRDMRSFGTEHVEGGWSMNGQQLGAYLLAHPEYFKKATPKNGNGGQVKVECKVWKNANYEVKYYFIIRRLSDGKQATQKHLTTRKDAAAWAEKHNYTI